MIHETFGDRLQKELDKRDMLRKEFANRVHISESMLSKYLNNKSLPRIDVLKHICIMLGVSSDYLLGLDKNLVNQGPVIESAYKTGFKMGRLTGMADSVMDKV